MATLLVVPTSGPYTGLWGGTSGGSGYPAMSVGTQNDDGFQLQATFAGQEVNLSDAYGMTLVEAIYRGQNWKCIFRGLEWQKSGLLTSLQMFNQLPAVSGLSTLAPILQGIGDRWSRYCQVMVLNAILGNPPTTPQSLTAPFAGLSPNSQTAFNMTSKLREMPLEFIFLPSSVTVASVTTITPFTTM